jgi:hypothetical protein
MKRIIRQLLPPCLLLLAYAVNGQGTDQQSWNDLVIR